MVKPQLEAYPGLEVVHHQDAKQTHQETYSHLEAIQVDARDKSAFVTNNHESEGLQIPGDENTSPVPPKPRWSRKRKLILVALVAVIVVAIVAGATCGTLLQRNSSGRAFSFDAPDTASIPTSTPSADSPMDGEATIQTNYSAPVALSWGYPHLEVIVNNGTEKPLWLHRDSASNWTAATTTFTPLGGTAAAMAHSISGITRGGNNTDLFAIGGNDRGLYQKSHDASMSWSPAGSDWNAVDTGAVNRKALYSPPGVGSWSESRVDVFAIGQEGEMWQYYWEQSRSTWVGWESFGGDFVNLAPTILSWSEGRYDIFAVNINGSLAYKYYDGKWSPSQDSGTFYDLGGQLTSSPVGVAPEVGQMHIFARGGDSGLWHLSFDGRWGNWSRLGRDNDTIKGDPSVVLLEDKIFILAWSEDDSLLTTTMAWRTGVFTPAAAFSRLANGLVGAPTGVTDGVDVHVFAQLENNFVGWQTWSNGSWPEATAEMLGMWPY